MVPIRLLPREVAGLLSKRISWVYNTARLLGYPIDIVVPIDVAYLLFRFAFEARRYIFYPYNFLAEPAWLAKVKESTEARAFRKLETREEIAEAFFALRYMRPGTSASNHLHYISQLAGLSCSRIFLKDYIYRKCCWLYLASKMPFVGFLQKSKMSLLEMDIAYKFKKYMATDIGNLTLNTGGSCEEGTKGKSKHSAGRV